MVTTLQNEVASYDSTILTYMLLIQVFCAVISSYGWLKIQQIFKLGTKTMFNATAVLTTACSVWGRSEIALRNLDFMNFGNFGSFRSIGVSLKSVLQLFKHNDTTSSSLHGALLISGSGSCLNPRSEGEKFSSFPSSELLAQHRCS